MNWARSPSAATGTWARPRRGEKIDCVITVGGIAARHCRQRAREHGVEATFTGDYTEAAAILRSIARNGDIVLIKGSRSVRMETIVEELARP